MFPPWLYHLLYCLCLNLFLLPPILSSILSSLYYPLLYYPLIPIPPNTPNIRFSKKKKFHPIPNPNSAGVIFEKIWTSLLYLYTKGRLLTQGVHLINHTPYNLIPTIPYDTHLHACSTAFLIDFRSCFSSITPTAEEQSSVPVSSNDLIIHASPLDR